MKAEQKALTARWVFPVDGPPLPNGVVTYRGETIAAVEPAGARTADVDLGNAAILPGLVNAHTHLDLSGLAGKCPPTADFTQWLRGVIAHRRQQTPVQIAADIGAGLAQCLKTGTTLLGDIAVQGQSWSALHSASLRSVVFLETLGLIEERLNSQVEAAMRWLDSCEPSVVCRPGLSPHAPYSTHHILYDATAKLAAERGLRLATHLAETKDELRLLAGESSAFEPFLKEMGVWNPKAWHTSPERYVANLQRHTDRFILAHCNGLPIETPIPRAATIVYCPRTHAAFGHPPHPFRDFLKRGVRVALGTDSLASNPDLDLLAEMRFVHRLYPDFPNDALLRMGTLSGAEALGWDEVTGSLTPGKSADLVVVPLPNEEGEPHRLLFESREPVARSMFGGV
jgi:cytosine/adenosine deaminase-related metal-dependent hydrolase